MANINKIKLSGTTYNIQDLSAAKTVELTQAQYDALVSGGTVDPNTFYIITDAEGTDLSNYYTSAQTESAITAAVSGKADTSAVTEEITAAVSGKQDTLISGTNIKTINNESLLGSGNITIQGGGGTSYTAGDGIDITNDVISVTGKADTSAVTESINAAVSGKADTSAVTAIQDSLSGYVATSAITTAVTSGSTDSEIPTAKAVFDAIPTGGTSGGKAISAGTNISVTTGETADTINCILPYYRDSGYCWTIYGYNNSYYANSSSTKVEYSAYIGFNNVINNLSTLRYTQHNIIIGFGNKLESNYTEYYMGGNIIIGENNTLSGANNIRESYVIGKSNKGYGIQEFICGWSNEARNTYETSFGFNNISTSGVSIFGYSGNTLFSIGNGNYFGSDRHNAFEIRQNGDIYIADTNDTSTTNYYQKPMIKLQDTITALGGLKLVKLTQSEYDALATKDDNTVYFIGDSNGYTMKIGNVNVN